MLIFWSGFLVGFLCNAWLSSRMKNYGGTIVINTDDLTEKTVYSLILDDYPDKLEFKKEVIFRVDTPVEGLDRT
jgi:hypothetical protein